MDEYISREAVEQVLRGIANGLSVGETEALKAKGLKALYKIQGAKEILNSVDNDLCFIPAAGVQPVKRGRWEKDEKRNSFEKFCSICKHEAYWDTDYGQQLFDYCPYCGADMRGGENND